MKFYQLLAPGGRTTSLEPRKQYVASTIFRMNEINESFDSMHSMMVSKPEEETFFLDGLGLSFIRICSMPQLDIIRNEFESINWEYGYVYLKQMMKATLIEDPFVEKQNHFCMKSIQHFAFLDCLLKQFPEGKYIWIHRDPIEVITSSLPLFNQVRLTFGEENSIESLKWFNYSVINCFSMFLKRALEIRKQFEKEYPSHFIDISFKELTKNPLKTIEQIYGYFNMNVSDEMIKNIQEELNSDESPSRKHGSSEEMEQLLVVSHDEIRSVFDFYYKEFTNYL